MMSFFTRYRSLLFAGMLSITAGAYADDAAHDWLMKMSHAARKLNYQGTFVYQHGNQIEVMRILHSVSDKGVRERLLSLNGARREIIRDNDLVRCYLPDENAVMVGHRKANQKSFPSILPSQLKALDDNYTMILGGVDRISDRQAQLIAIKPKDDYRYGYRLWADRKTGLLVKTDLVAPDGRLIEQFMFTDVLIGQKIDPQDLEPSNAGKDMVWHRNSTSGNIDMHQSRWKLQGVPKGFRQTVYMRRRMSMQQQPVEHLVLSDGLAAVSIFIEERDKKRDSSMSGLNSMGAVHVYTSVLDNYQIIVVGEVPAKTVSAINSGISLNH